MTSCSHQPMRCKLRQELKACPPLRQSKKQIFRNRHFSIHFSISLSTLENREELRNVHDELISLAKKETKKNPIQFKKIEFNSPIFYFSFSPWKIEPISMRQTPLWWACCFSADSLCKSTYLLRGFRRVAILKEDHCFCLQDLGL